MNCVRAALNPSMPAEVNVERMRIIADAPFRSQIRSFAGSAHCKHKTASLTFDTVMVNTHRPLSGALD